MLTPVTATGGVRCTDVCWPLILTALAEQGTVPLALQTALEQLHTSGCALFMVTGRRFAGVQLGALENLFAGIVWENGAVLHHVAADEVYLPFDEEEWYNIIREKEGLVTRSSPGPRPRGSDTLATISITQKPAGASPTGGLLQLKCAGDRR